MSWFAPQLMLPLLPNQIDTDLLLQYKILYDLLYTLYTLKTSSLSLGSYMLQLEGSYWNLWEKLPMKSLLTLRFE